MKTNTRPLRATDSRFYLGPTAKSQGETLCNFCHRRGRDCDLPETQEGCAHLVPALFFVGPHVGMNGVFSTFRASEVWFERARAVQATHNTIALVDTVTLETIGRASIIEAHKGPFWGLMENHAASNHLAIGHGWNPHEAPKKLEHWIRNKMGSRYVKQREAICTVIYLKRHP